MNEIVKHEQWASVDTDGLVNSGYRARRDIYNRPCWDLVTDDVLVRRVIQLPCNRGFCVFDYSLSLPSIEPFVPWEERAWGVCDGEVWTR